MACEKTVIPQDIRPSAQSMLKSVEAWASKIPTRFLDSWMSLMLSPRVSGADEFILSPFGQPAFATQAGSASATTFHTPEAPEDREDEA